MAMAVAPTSTILSLSALRRNRSVDYVDHRVLLISPVGAGVVNESGAVARWVQFVLAELDALEPGLGDIGGDVLVGNLFVFPHGLQSQRREEILVPVTHDKERVAQRAIGIRIDVDESVGRCNFRQLGDVGLGPGGDRAAIVDPGLAHVEVTAVFGFDLENLGKRLGPRDVEIFLRQLGIGRSGALLVQKQVTQHDVAGLLQRRGEDRILIAGRLEVLDFFQERRRERRSPISA